MSSCLQAKVGVAWSTITIYNLKTNKELTNWALTILYMATKHLSKVVSDFVDVGVTYYCS